MKHYLLTFLLSLSGMISYAEETHKLPVLKIYFEGEIVKGMEYSNGYMNLTDTDDNVIQLPAKFKTRGATASSYMMKPSLNMKLRTRDYVEEMDSALLGMRSCSSWILDAMAIDCICMRNRLCFDIWNEFSRLPYATQFDGRNGTEGRFVELYINDRYYGIYHLMDRINRKLLDLKKVQEKEDGSVLVRGVLYKSGTQNIPNQNEPCYSTDSSTCVIEWHNAWELTYPEEYGGKVAWAPLQDAILKGKNKDYVKRHFYLQNLADYQILVMALSIADNWGNKNRYLSIRNITKNINDTSQDEADRRRFVVTPWDLDTGFGGHYEGAYYDGNYNDWKVIDVVKSGPYPIPFLQDDVEYLTILKLRWIEGRKGAFSPASVFSKLEGYRDLFLRSGAWQRMVDYFEAQKSRPKYVLDLSREISHIEEWYANRFREMDAYFGIDETETEVGIPANEELGRVKTVQSYGGIYDLSGRKFNSQQGPSPSKNPEGVQRSISSGEMPKGIYINNGKKRVIK